MEKRYIESNTGKSARQGNLWHPRVSEISLSCTFCRCLILFLTFPLLFLTLLCSCVLFDSYVFLAADHVNNVSYFPFVSIKTYLCVLREGYYVIIWLIVRICAFIKDWKLIYSELFILKGKAWRIGGSWHTLYSMQLPVKRTWFFLSCTSASCTTAR
jgi:hypothetical protein